MAVVPSKDPRYNFDIVPDPPLERALGVIGYLALAAILSVVGLAVVVWAFRIVF